jgi:hypothetical protein
MAERVVISEVIEYVKAVLEYLRRLRPFRGQAELIWEAEQHLARLLELGHPDRAAVPAPEEAP